MGSTVGFTPFAHSGGLEFTIVGDIDADAFMSLCLNTKFPSGKMREGS